MGVLLLSSRKQIRIFPRMPNHFINGIRCNILSQKFTGTQATLWNMLAGFWLNMGPLTFTGLKKKHHWTFTWGHPPLLSYVNICKILNVSYTCRYMTSLPLNQATCSLSVHIHAPRNYKKWMYDDPVSFTQIADNELLACKKSMCTEAPKWSSRFIFDRACGAAEISHKWRGKRK